MEVSTVLDSPKKGESEAVIQDFELELELSEYVVRSDHRFQSMNALEILRETVRILRYNSWAFMVIAAVLICPLSAILLSNIAVDESMVKRLTLRLLLVAKTSGLPLKPFVKQSCQRFSEMVISSIFCFPLFVTGSLLSKAAIVYCVGCTYSRKKFDSTKFISFVSKIWRRLVLTYIWVCMLIIGCLFMFIILLVTICNIFSIVGVLSDSIIYAAMLLGLAFSVVFANAVIVGNIAIVISVLENVSGLEALLRSGVVLRGQTHVGLLMFLGSTIGMAFVEGLFEHRVKTLSYGDGSSRIWEGPLLVLMNSFVVLIDSMMSAVFYFSCRYSTAEASVGEHDSHLDTNVSSSLDN